MLLHIEKADDICVFQRATALNFCNFPNLRKIMMFVRSENEIVLGDMRAEHGTIPTQASLPAGDGIVSLQISLVRKARE